MEPRSLYIEPLALIVPKLVSTRVAQFPTRFGRQHILACLDPTYASCCLDLTVAQGIERESSGYADADFEARFLGLSS